MGSFPVDIDLRIDPSSALKAYKKFTDSAKSLMADVASGVEGAEKKLQSAHEDFARSVISTSTRAGRAIESSIKALERQAEVAGKTRSEQLLVRQEKWIKMLGDDEKAVQRVTAAFQKLIAVEQEEERKRQAGPGVGGLLFRGARDIFEGRMTYGAMDIGRAVMAGGGAGGGGGAAGTALGAGGMAAGLSGIGMAAGGAAIGIGALAAVGYEAAKSMGELGASIHDVQMVTGMSAVEVQRFQVAAKMAGQDVSMLDRMMRGLTQAATDNTAAGDKGRAALQRWGVDTWGLATGTVSLTEVLNKMSDSISKQPNVFLRDADAIAVFKRSGIDAVAAVAELAEAKKKLGEADFLTESDIKQAREMNAELIVMETKVGLVYDKVKLFMGQEFLHFLTGLRETAGLIVGGITGGIPGAIAGAVEGSGLEGAHPSASVQSTYAERTERIRSIKEERQFNAELARQEAGSLEAAEAKLGEIKKHYEDIRHNRQLSKDDHAEYVEQVRQANTELQRQKTLVEAMRDAESNRKANMEAIRKLAAEIDEKRLHPYGMLEADRRAMEYQARPGVTAQQIQQYEALLAGLRRDEILLNMQKAAGIARTEMGKVSGILMGEPTTPESFARANSSEAYLKRVTEVFQREQKLWHDTTGKINEEFIRATEELLAADDRLARARAEGAAKISFLLGPQNIETRMAEQAQLYQATVAYAEDEFNRKSAKIADEYTDQTNREIALHGLRMDQAAKEAEARNKYMEAYATEIKQQIDQIKSAVEPLYQTLFTNPSKFGAQLRSTLQQAALRPIVSGLSETTARILHPTIFGETGTGGIAGGLRNLFGGANRLNDVRLINGAIPVVITGVTGGVSGGSGGTTVYTGGSFIGGDTLAGGGGGYQDVIGMSRTNLLGDRFRRFIQGDTGGGGDYARFSTTVYGAPDLADLPISSPRGSWADVQTLGAAIGRGVTSGMTGGGGGGGGAGGTVNPISKAISGFLGKWFGGSYAGSGGLDRIGTNIGQYGGAITAQGATMAARITALSTGPFAGTKAGPAAGAIGAMLAMQGIFGEQRGRAGGIVEAAGGGFLAAGPIGAAIGGGIGLGEMLAGVEAPRYEAKRLVQSIYHIGINNTTADQIVNIANQSYAGRVSIAVRSPEVRHMLGLYAAGTGQADRFPISSTEARGASLVESGGSLYQQATYQYGNAYSYASNLPVYGGSPTHIVGGGAGGNLSLSLNIGGQDAAKFMTGQVVTPDVVQSQYQLAMNNSNGRVPQALMMTEPGAIAS